MDTQKIIDKAIQQYLEKKTAVNNKVSASNKRARPNGFVENEQSKRQRTTPNLDTKRRYTHEREDDNSQFADAKNDTSFNPSTTAFSNRAETYNNLKNDETFLVI